MPIRRHETAWRTYQPVLAILLTILSGSCAWLSVGRSTIAPRGDTPTMWAIARQTNHAAHDSLNVEGSYGGIEMTRRMWALMLGMTLLSGVTGAALTRTLAPSVTSAQPDVLRARAVEVHDSEGRTLAALRTSEGQFGTGAGLMFYDRAGRVHLSLGQLEVPMEQDGFEDLDVQADEGIILSIRDDAGRLRFGLGLSSNGAVVGITMFDAEGNLIWSAP
jgi:hypothetical protein